MTLADALRARLGCRPGAPYGPTLEVQIEALCGLLDDALAGKLDRLPPRYADGADGGVTAKAKRKTLW